MIVVLDTNVLVSGIFFAGAPLEILERRERGEFAIAVSSAILDEYQRVIQRLQSKYDLDAGAPILDVIRVKAITVADAELPARVCEDASDDKFLACAIEARAALVVSGDRLLLRTSGYSGVAIVRPRTFLDEYL